MTYCRQLGRELHEVFGWRRAVLTARQLAVWFAFFKLWYEGDKPDISLDGVPLAVQRRWEGKVAGAAAAVYAGSLRREKARRIAKQTGRDEGQVWDELRAKGE